MTEGSHRVQRRIAVGGFALGVVIELTLIAIGVAYLVSFRHAVAGWLLAAWCILGAVYVLGIAATLFVASRSVESDEPPRLSELFMEAVTAPQPVKPEDAS